MSKNAYDKRDELEAEGLSAGKLPGQANPIVSVERDEPDAFPPAQEAALQRLAAGTTVQAAAEQIGMARSTVSRWMNEDPRFRAAYNALRRERRDSMQARLLGMVDQALDTVDAALKKQDTKSAWALLRHAGAITPGSADEEDLRQTMELRSILEQFGPERANALKFMHEWVAELKQKRG